MPGGRQARRDNRHLWFRLLWYGMIDYAMAIGVTILATVGHEQKGCLFRLWTQGDEGYSYRGSLHRACR